MRARWFGAGLGIRSKSGIVLFALAAAVAVAPAAAAGPGRDGEAAPAGILEGGAETARALSEATGLAISPLLVLAAKGAYRDWRASPADRDHLPWYARRVFWIPAAVLIVLVLLKEVILGRVIALKKPLDQLQLVENTISGLLACPVAVSGLAALLEPRVAGAVAWTADWVLPVAHAAPVTGPMLTSFAGTVASVVAVVGGCALFAAVWMASQALNVLLLLSPMGLIDNAVKLFRLMLLGLVVVLVWLYPPAGIAVCLTIMAIAVSLAPWSMRLMIFGWIFSTDVLRARRFDPTDSSVRAFAVSGLATVPRRAYGTLRRTARGLDFTYRAWPFFRKRTVRISADGVEVCAALVSPVIVRVREPGPYETLEQLFRLPPRYRGREANAAAALGGLPVRESRMHRELANIRGWLSFVVDL